MRNGILERRSGVNLDNTLVRATVPVKNSRSRITLHRPGETVIAEEVEIDVFDLRGKRERSL